ncbi:Shedu anti-phage system protein SduA domain-containing protein [Ensifer sp. BR816]|uniref:Shedu anti-phage system protein SduA domain-containing protein n=1 Tax=Rhizobium sp. (strain BR816) TaxID=1057002 RepID=UPI00036021BA|nr:Shedu anti-phage system protein SduA domain-containing protein [Ensifer sp. BR816]
MKTHKQEFIELLSGLDKIERKLREPRVQTYLERNVQLICPEHYIAPRMVISKLRVGADFACDFAYFAPVSGANYLNLVEIKDPTCSLFTIKNTITSFIRDALDQVRTNLRWASDHRPDIESLRAELAAQFPATESGMAFAKGILYCGRRSEIESHPERRAVWQEFVSDAKKHVEIRTFDGLMQENTFAFAQTINADSEIKCYARRRRRYYLKHPN